MKYILKHELDKQDPLAAILQQRGIDDVESYLNVTKDVELDPFLLDNMLNGVNLLVKHLNKKSKIFIQIDSDFDGFSSAAMIYNYIKTYMDEEADIVWGIHENKHHGIIVDKIPQGVALVIVPDAGSNDFSQHKELHDSGIDVLVLDHHECSKYSKDAIVINNQISKNYPNKTLSGGGVTYKFCKAIDQIKLTNFAENFIDLCGTSLVSDMMDLRNEETHYYVKSGLKTITNTGLSHLIEMQAYSIGDTSKITPTNIAWYITPLINALIRVGTQEEKKTLFEALIDGDRIVPSTKRGAKGMFEKVAEQACRICTNARNRQNRQIDDALEKLEFKIQKNELFLNSVIFVPIDDEKIESSLTGLIAMKICSKYKKPTIVARKNDDGFWRGSARGIASIEIDGLKDFFDDSGMFEYTAGHQYAHGISIHEKKVDRFLAYANDKLSNVEFNEDTHEVDYELTPGIETTKIVSSLGGGAQLWGQGIEEPKIAIKNISVFSDSIVLMGTNKDTIKINSYGTWIIKFKDKTFLEELTKYSPANLTIVGTANLNEWGGQTSAQVFIKDYEIKDGRKEF